MRLYCTVYQQACDFPGTLLTTILSSCLACADMTTQDAERLQNMQEWIHYYQQLSRQWDEYIGYQQRMSKAWEQHLADLQKEIGDIKTQMKGPLLPPGVDKDSHSVKEAWIRYHKGQLDKWMDKKSV